MHDSWWKDDDNQTKSRGPVDVSHDAHNSLQPEMHGIWAGLKLLDLAVKLKPNTSRQDLKLTTHADNDEAVQ